MAKSRPPAQTISEPCSLKFAWPVDDTLVLCVQSLESSWLSAIASITTLYRVTVTLFTVSLLRRLYLVTTFFWRAVFQQFLQLVTCWRWTNVSTYKYFYFNFESYFVASFCVYFSAAIAWPTSTLTSRFPPSFTIAYIFTSYILDKTRQFKSADSVFCTLIQRL